MNTKIIEKANEKREYLKYINQCIDIKDYETLRELQGERNSYLLSIENVEKAKDNEELLILQHFENMFEKRNKPIDEKIKNSKQVKQIEQVQKLLVEKYDKYGICCDYMFLEHVDNHKDEMDFINEFIIDLESILRTIEIKGLQFFLMDLKYLQQYNEIKEAQEEEVKDYNHYLDVMQTLQIMDEFNSFKYDYDIVILNVNDYEQFVYYFDCDSFNSFELFDIFSSCNNGDNYLVKRNEANKGINKTGTNTYFYSTNDIQKEMEAHINFICDKLLDELPDELIELLETEATND